MVERVVYLGTDLQIFTRLAGDVPLHLRVQNTGNLNVPTPGTRVGLKLEQGAARLLAD